MCTKQWSLRIHASKSDGAERRVSQFGNYSGGLPHPPHSLQVAELLEIKSSRNLGNLRNTVNQTDLHDIN